MRLVDRSVSRSRLANLTGQLFSRLVGRSIGRANDVAANDGFGGSSGRLGDDRDADGGGGDAGRSYKQHAVHRSGSQLIAADRSGSPRQQNLMFRAGKRKKKTTPANRIRELYKSFFRIYVF